MRRCWILLAALAAWSLVPSVGTELSTLRPAAAVYVKLDGKTVSIATDMGDFGSGETLDAAFCALNRSAAGTVFLDTAENLIVNREGVALLPELQKLFRPEVRLCASEQELDLEAAAEYLKLHRPRMVLEDAEPPLQKLMENEGRFSLEDE